MLTTKIERLYHKARRDKPFMLVGSDAACSLRFARTIARFEELQNEGVVRLRAEYEQEAYDMEGMDLNERQRKELADTLERDGVHYCVSEYLSPITDEWEHADSIGMCVYSDPLDPFQNCYICQLMQEAIEQYEKTHADRTR